MPGKHAEEKADDRVGQHQAQALAELDERLDHVAQPEPRREVLHVADALLLGRGEDLADAEEPDGHRHEADAREQRDESEVQALLAGDRVEPHRREQQPEREHREALHRRLGAQSDEGRE